MVEPVRRSDDPEDTSLFGDETRFRLDPVPPARPTRPDPDPPTPPAVSDRGTDELAARLDESDRRISAIDRRTAAMQSRLEDVAKALGLLGRRLQEQTEAVDAASTRAAEQSRRSRGADVAEVTRGTTAKLEELRTEFERRLDGLEANQHRAVALVDGLSAALDAEGASLRMEQERLTALFVSLRDDLPELLQPDADRTVIWNEVMARVERAMAAQSSRVESGLASLRQRVNNQLDEAERARAAGADHLTDEIARLRELTDHRLAASGQLAADASAAVSRNLQHAESAVTDGLDGVRAALSGVVGPLAQLETSVEGLASSGETMAAAVAESSARMSAMDARVATVERAMQNFEAVIRDRMQEVVEQGIERLVNAVSVTREELTEITGSGAEQLHLAGEQAAQHVATVVADMESGLHEEISAALAEARDRLSEVHDDAQAVSRRFEAFEEVLAAVLAEHNQALADQRRHLVHDLVSSLADGLTKRDRRRLAAKLEVPPPPATVDMSRRIREVFELAANRDLVSGRFLDDAEASESDDDEPAPSTATPTTTPRRSAATAATPKRVIRRSPPLAEVLDGVAGLSAESRAELLEYATVDALRAASDDDLLAIRGIGPAMLERVRAAVEAR